MNNNIKVLVEGKNVNNYIKWLIKQKVSILSINVVKYNKLELVIDYKDYSKIKTYSKTYNYKIIKKYGKIKIFEILKSNTYMFVSLLFAIIFLYVLSNMIFSVEVLYNEQNIVTTIKKELQKYGIEKYRFKKDYEYLEKVKKEILNNNKNILEWIEIVENGTKYTIKVVERKKEEKKENFEYQSIYASKDAIITNIKAISGEKNKEINDYVKKDELIVSGILTKPDGSLIYKQANAKVYGEVWYKVNVEYPYAYSEERLTGKSKEVYVINFLNKKIPIFTYKKYKSFKIVTNNIIMENNILPINLSKEKQYEVKVIDDIYTWEEAISKAIEISKKRLLESNDKINKINKIEILNKETIGTKIRLNLFFSVEEDITKIVEINPNAEIIKEN